MTRQSDLGRDDEIDETERVAFAIFLTNVLGVPAGFVGIPESEILWLSLLDGHDYYPRPPAGTVWNPSSLTKLLCEKSIRDTYRFSGGSLNCVFDIAFALIGVFPEFMSTVNKAVAPYLED